MDDNYNKPTKRRNKYAGKEDISREITNTILTDQIEQLREISRTNDEIATKIQESINILYQKQIPINTTKLEKLNNDFISEIERKLHKVKRPSKGFIWYIMMWTITLISAFLAGYYIHEYREWKSDAVYWYEQYEEIKVRKSSACFLSSK